MQERIIAEKQLVFYLYANRTSGSGFHLVEIFLLTKENLVTTLYGLFDLSANP